MISQSPMELLEQRKRRITLIGFGIIAALLVAVIAAASAQNAPNSEYQFAKEQRDQGLAELRQYQELLEPAQSQLDEIEAELGSVQEKLARRKAAGYGEVE